MFSSKELPALTAEIGNEKVNKGFWKVLLSAFAAGMLVGLGYYGYIVLASNTELASGKFYGAIVFCTGLAMIIVAGGDLFTGNSLITFGLFHKKYTVGKVFQNLGVVFLGNFLGAIFLIILFYFSGITNDKAEFIIRLSEGKLSLSFVEALTRGILCNILVAIAVYMTYATKSVSGKIIIMFLPILLFVVSAFEHSVANMFVLPLAGLLEGKIDVISILFRNILPVTLGNFIGGGLIIPGLYHFIYKKKPDLGE